MHLLPLSTDLWGMVAMQLPLSTRGSSSNASEILSAHPRARISAARVTSIATATQNWARAFGGAVVFLLYAQAQQPSPFQHY